MCKNCSVGHYASRGGQTQCLPCIGGVANTTGNKACTPCAPGRFIADQGQGYGCKPCPRGTGPVTNRTACETCRGIQFSACGLCQDCRPPNVKIDNATCIKTNTKCQPGTQPRNQASASSNRGDTCNGADLICSQCKAGSVSLEGRECVACNEGNKVSNDRQTVCESCSPGKEPSSDRSACNDCTGNKVSSFGTACTPCASNSIVSGNHTRCAECSQGQEPTQNQSICRCTKGRFNSSQLVVRCFGAQGFLNKQGPDAASATSECLGCPPCLDCFGGEMPLTTAGYRVIPRVRNSAVSVSQVHIFRCPYARSCLPAAVANETTVGSCLHGHTGVLCQGCVSGWSRAPGGRCYECLGGTLQWALLPALILIGLILLYLVLSKYLARKQKKREKEMGSSGLFFDCLDSDNSGTITRDELRQGLAELGMSMSEATTFDVLDNIDTDGSGDVDRDEFGNTLSVSITTCVISLTPCCKHFAEAWMSHRVSRSEQFATALKIIIGFVQVYKLIRVSSKQEKATTANEVA